MTHNTDAELLPCPFCGTDAKAVNSYEDDDWRVECWSDECSVHGKRCQNRSDAALEWNRRAPAAPVPQGWKMVPVEPPQEALYAIDRLVDDPRAFEDSESFWDYLLAAAPQPPDAFQTEGGLKSEIRTTSTAPVQMPEPAGCVVYANGESHHWDANRECAELFASRERSHGATYAFTFENLYTEQQVRQLLDTNGIKANK